MFYTSRNSANITSSSDQGSKSRFESCTIFVHDFRARISCTIARFFFNRARFSCHDFCITIFQNGQKSDAIFHVICDFFLKILIFFEISLKIAIFWSEDEHKEFQFYVKRCIFQYFGRIYVFIYRSL